MDRDEALKLLRGGEDGVKEWNRRRKEGEEIPNLNGADLSGAILRHADLDRADLSHANLSGAILIGAHFGNADLTFANLKRADFSHANLVDARLGHANLIRTILRCAVLGSTDLSEAHLSDANLSDAYLTYVNFRGANLGHTIFGGAKFSYNALDNIDLSETQGLEEVVHGGPSSIGLDTIIRSKGNIPQAFLEGCGVPDNWITFLPSLLGKAIDFYSCFISYSHEDEEFTKRLHSRMREDKLRVWFAPEDMKAGRKIYEQIDAAIKLHDMLLVVLSESSMQSEWVMTEISVRQHNPTSPCCHHCRVVGNWRQRFAPLSK